MDSILQKRLNDIASQIDKLKISEELFLNLDASKKAQYGTLYLTTSGTVAEREAKVHMSKIWNEFTMAHVAAETEYNREKRMLELYIKAYDAEHITYKIENQGINRPGSQS